MSPISFTISSYHQMVERGKENNGPVNERGGWQSMVKGVVVNGLEKEFLS